MMARLSTDAARLNTMPKTSATNTPFHIVFGGDSYLNEQTVRDQCVAAQRKYPDAELIELDAMGADHYAFDEAVSPSLLSDRAIVKIVNLQGADEKLGDAMVEYCRQACKDPTDCSIVICQHEGGVKGKRLVDQLTKAGADKQVVPDLKKADAKLNFVMQCFDRRNRRVDPMAAQQLVAVLGEKTGELAAMVAQLCFDFDDDPMGLNRVNQYLDSNPQVTGFVVADQAMAGRSAACRYHFSSRGENEPVGTQECHTATSRMDFGRSGPMHPDACMGGRAKQNQWRRPGLCAGTLHRTH